MKDKHEFLNELPDGAIAGQGGETYTDRTVLHPLERVSTRAAMAYIGRPLYRRVGRPDLPGYGKYRFVGVISAIEGFTNQDAHGFVVEFPK